MSPARGTRRVRALWLLALPVLQGCSCVAFSNRLCIGADPPAVSDPAAFALLRAEQNKKLGRVAKALGFVTTPFKRAGLLGWRDLGFDVSAVGRVVQAAWSTDLFLTVDLRLEALAADGVPVELHGDRYLRAEVCLRALKLAKPERPCPGDRVRIAGRLMWDSDPPRGWLEVHPQSAQHIEILEPGHDACPWRVATPGR